MMKHFSFKLTALALCLAGVLNATAQIEFTPTETFVSTSNSHKEWGQCFDAISGDMTPVKLAQQDDAIHFTVWTNDLKETREFTIRHEQLAGGMKYLVYFQDYLKQTYARNIRLTKNLFSFNDEYVLVVCLADGSGVLLNEKNEKVGEIPSGIIEHSYYGDPAKLGYIHYNSTPYLVGKENDNDENPVYSISCWADKKQALHKQADLNNDGEVDVADVNKIIDVVLGRE